MKIGLLIYGSLDTVSGGYYYDRKLVEYLRSQGDEVEIISLPWRNYASHLTDNLRFRLSNGLDILIQDELNHPSLILANRGKHHYPVISLVHHLRSSELRPAWQNSFYKIVEKNYLESVDGFIFNSKTTQDVVSDLVGSSKPAIIAYPPTDRFGIPVSEEQIEERSSKNPFRILFVGNIIERKGLYTLLQALRVFDRSRFTLDVVGSLESEPAYVDKIKKYAEDNDLSAIVRFHGILNTKVLKPLLAQAHVLVVPSSYEGFGIVYLEGMGFGLPAIGTTAGAAGEIIEHGQTGYLIPPDDFESLADHLAELNNDREALIQLSLGARRRYLNQPKWDEIALSIRKFLYSF